MSDLQTALAAEHAAVYLLGVLGGRTSESREPALFAAITAAHAEHRDRRDDLVAALAASGRTPVGTEPAYAVPEGIETPAGVRAAALDLERRCTATYAAVVGGTSADDRTRAIALLQASALAELRFGGTPAVLPGLEA
ncbi:ferritin-like domain-containing protein [Nocardioides sp. SYSU D00038]|uniref:ferritin-like domain-containing protein n=1 Tax=Nocardioides sp. SYSU D00038 TaxID=2812554 RepID=UPI001966D413|nr:ferritin-like domain-containing protein [Nocardioides sp. SYSU D00038]